MSALRSIVHLDADAFFASVEQAADARLRGRPIAVGGEKRGIIASASYEARKFGIYTPMPTVLARRLCPKLILLPGDFEKYELFSRLMFSYAYDFTPDVEIGSIDEGYFDLTGVRRPAVGVAQTVRQAIRQALKLSVSEGIAANKLVSQIASKLKKPAAFEFVPPGSEAVFLSPLANKWLPGIGPKLGSQMNSAGLARIGQIANTPVELLALLAGSRAPQLRNFARGIDERQVVPARAPAKSYGEQETFAADTTNEEFLEATLRRMADQLMTKVRADGKSIRTVTVKVRYNDMDEEQASQSLPEPTDLECDIYGLTSKLLRKAWQRRVSLRLVSLKLSNVYEGRLWSGLALDVSARRHDAQERLAGVVDALREKFGRNVVLHGHDFVLRIQQAAPGVDDPARAGIASERTIHNDVEIPSLHGVGRGLGRGASSTYSLAAVQRQRLGSYAARHRPSAETRPKGNPSPEIRFREPPTSQNSKLIIRIAAHSLKQHPIPLNVHSYYSFLDSTLSPKAIIELAQRHELPAIALTDKHNLHGAVEFAQAAAEAGIKPILGAEVQWRGHRVCLYVQDEKGYHNLCRILNEGSGFRVQVSRVQVSGLPRGSSEQRRLSSSSSSSSSFSSSFSSSSSSSFSSSIRQVSGAEDFGDTTGLLALSPCAELAPLFPSRFYLETNGLGAFEKRVAGLPCAASFPVHYELPADRWKYDIIQSIRTLTLLRQAHPAKRLQGDYHFRSGAEMQRLFGAHPELLAHSREIAERCSFTFSFGKPQFPGYTPPDGLSPAAFLRRLVFEGLKCRYPRNHAQLRSQLEQELGIITEVGYEEYFLVMWDILQECRRQGIEWITRGSAADSLACYCLEISGVCPIRFDLYFRRFLNKDRMALNKLPDIDVDFPHDRKDDVIDLIFNKFKVSNTAIVGGFSTFQARSAFAEIAKVLGVSEFQVRRLTERLPHFSRAGELAEAVAITQECRDLPLQEEPYRTALQLAAFLDGFPRYPKMHPCGLVLSRQPMDQITPCFTSAKGYPTTHFDMDSIEAIGLVKMDILAQGGLAVMRDVKEMLAPDRGPSRPAAAAMRSAAPKSFQPPNAVERAAGRDGPRSGEVLSLEALEPWDDPRVWELIASGNARAVHHIESPAMISLCKMCQVHDIDTLIAIVSVIRPGAANESKKMEFARRYQGLSPVRYPHPSLELCLHSTYGLVVYEEHILQICEAFAGLPPGRADILRRALGKEKIELIAQIQTEFAQCARQRGRSESEIAEVWGLVVGFRGYAFCKAHSTAYGVEAYQSAWLKLNHPAEFMAAVLTNGKGFYSPVVYVLECHRLGIPLLPPSINEPGPAFSVVKHPARHVHESRITDQASRITHHGSRITDHSSIRVPVLQVKGLTQRTKEALVQERKRAAFSSMHDFFLRVQPLPEEMESLIRIGAFDQFGKPRTAQYWEFKALNAEGRSIPHGTPAQPDLFQRCNGLPPGILSEPNRLERLRAEEELLGYPASGHPLELFPDIAWESYCPINRLGRHLGEQIVTCGLVIEQRLFHQVTGEPMKFITIADWTGMAETELFAKTYKSYGLNTVRYRVLEITATVEPFENGRGHTLRVLRAGKPRERQKSEGRALRVPILNR